MLDGVIYQIINITNNHSYIGYTIRFEKRMIRHHNDSKTVDLKLYRAIRKHGIDNFVVRVVEYVPENELSEREKYWIKFFNTKQQGYNMTDGGDGGDTISGRKLKPLSEYARKKMSQSRVGEKNPNFGKPRSDEVKRKVGEWSRKYWSTHKPTNYIYFNDEQTNEIIFQYNLGKNFKDIGKMLNTSKGPIGRKINEMIEAGELTRRYKANIIEENYI